MKEDDETNVEQILHLYCRRAEGFFFFFNFQALVSKSSLMHHPAGCDAVKIAPDTRIIIIIYTANNTEGIYFLIFNSCWEEPGGSSCEKRQTENFTVLHNDVHANVKASDEGCPSGGGSGTHTLDRDSSSANCITSPPQPVNRLQLFNILLQPTWSLDL